jgi:hypothetical protein
MYIFVRRQEVGSTKHDLTDPKKKMITSPIPVRNIVGEHHDLSEQLARSRIQSLVHDVTTHRVSTEKMIIIC